jgi:hypothetical protein
MDEIRISKKRLALGLALVVLAAGAGLSFLLLRRGQAARPIEAAALPILPAATPDDDSLAGAAALAGAKAFYTLDVNAGQEAWADALCALSTAAGCAMHRDVIIPALWPELANGQTASTVEVSVEEKVAEQSSPLGNDPLQVWRLDVWLSAPWPVQKEPLTRFAALALVARENGTWKFERFLSEEEAGAIAEKEDRP